MEEEKGDLEEKICYGILKVRNQVFGKLFERLQVYVLILVVMSQKEGLFLYQLIDFYVCRLFIQNS